MQSIRKKLDGNLPQFLDDVRKYGKWEAMGRWGLEKSYLPVSKILMEETGDENFGLNPTANSYLSEGTRGLLREVVVAFADYVVRTDRENEILKRQLEAYRVDSRQTEHQFADELVGLLETLKSSVPAKCRI